MQHNTQCDKILNAKKFRMPHTVQYRNPECDTRPNVDLPNICGPLPNTWGTLPNKYGTLPNTHESHYLTQSGQDIQMTQTNLLIIRITLLMTWLGWRVGTPPPLPPHTQTLGDELTASKGVRGHPFLAHACAAQLAQSGHGYRGWGKWWDWVGGVEGGVAAA